jgi:atypical dual specificity phosphatase
VALGRERSSDAEEGLQRNTTVPPPASVPTPGGFHWVLPKQLGGMQRPGLLREETDDLDGLVALQVRHLVSLTEVPFPGEPLEQRGIQGLHCPIEDMNVPSLEGARELCACIDGWLEAEERVVLHCKAGLGRTGTLLACVLVYRGDSSVHAIHCVRQVNPLYIQSEIQLAFIDEFAHYLSLRDSRMGVA